MRAILLFFVFISSSYFVNAQETEKASFGFGAGLDISSVGLKSPASSVSPGYLTGFKGYIFVNAPLGKKFFIQPELAYDGMGWQFHGPDNHFGGQTADVRTYLNYITFAILPKYKVDNTGLAFYIGPYGSILLNATVKGFDDETYSDKKNYTDSNFGGIVGAEYYLPMGLGFSARYMAGISNIISNAEQGESMHTHAFSITVAYKLHSSK